MPEKNFAFTDMFVFKIDTFANEIMGLSCYGRKSTPLRKVGCSLGKENCYYLAESPKKRSPCDGCCYGPCVSFCMRKCMNEVFGTRMEVPKNV